MIMASRQARIAAETIHGLLSEQNECRIMMHPSGIADIIDQEFAGMLTQGHSLKLWVQTFIRIAKADAIPADEDIKRAEMAVGLAEEEGM
jgi:hypothetical protein